MSGAQCLGPPQIAWSRLSRHRIHVTSTVIALCEARGALAPGGRWDDWWDAASVRTAIKRWGYASG